MNKLLSLTLFLSASYAADAQKLILQPQVGIRNFEFKTSESFPQVTTLPTSASAGARLIYLSKQGHGPYLGFHVNSLIVKQTVGSSSFSKNYTLSTYEAGYQWMSKPVYFKRLWDNNLKQDDFDALSRKGWAIQFNPSLGLSYIRPLKRYTDYEASLNGTLGITGGMNFAFSKNGKQIFNLSVNYTKGLTELYHSNNYFTTSSPYRSTKGSGFNIGIGTPINLFRKK